MVGVNDGFMRVSYEVRSPGCESVNNGEKFFVVDVPVSLCGIESSGKESDGVELAFLIPLLKDGADSVSGGVAINRELIFKAGLSQDRGGANCIHEGVERRFKFVVPIKLPSSRAVSNKRVQRCGQHAKVADIHAVKIQEAEKCSNFLQSRGSFPSLHALDFDWVHGDGVFANNDTKVLHFVLLKLAFLGFQVKVVDCEDAQHIVYYTAMQCGVVRGVDKDVVHIYGDIAFIDEFAEEVIHHRLEGGGGIREAKEHDHWFEETAIRLERGLPLVAVFHTNVVVPPTDI